MALRDENRWSARPRLALALRLLTVLVPVALSVVVSLAAQSWLAGHFPTSHWVVPAMLALVPAILTLVVAERAMRRLLPLVMLLKLSLLFPDQVPSRLGIALRAASPKRLARSLGSTDPVEAAAAENILTLVAALNAHDRATRGHSERVRAVTMLLADQMKITGVERDKLEWAALLHDLGKLTVDPEILNKNGAPSDEEWHELRRHPAAGAPLARCLEGWLGEWVRAIDEHHERVDGTGYPNGLQGKQISLGGRIVAVSDAFEVMTAVRSYKQALTTSAAREELVKCAGTHFDPAVVRSFMGVSIAHLHKALGPTSWLLSLPLRGLVGQATRVGNALVGGIAPPVLASAAAVVLLSTGTAAIATSVGDIDASAPFAASASAVAHVEEPADHTDVQLDPAGRSATQGETGSPEDPSPTTAGGQQSEATPVAGGPAPVPSETAAAPTPADDATGIGLPLAIPTGVDGLELAPPNSTPVRDTVGSVTEPLRDTVGAVTDPLVGAVGAVGEPLLGVVGPVAEPLLGVVGPVAEPVLGAVGALGAGELVPELVVPLPTVLLPPVVVVPLPVPTAIMVPSVVAIPSVAPAPPVVPIPPILPQVVALPGSILANGGGQQSQASPGPRPSPTITPTATPNNVVSLIDRLN